MTVASSSKFIFSNFAYVCLAVALCQTYGLFREPLYKNVLLSALVFVELAATVLLTVVDWPVFDRLFQLRGAELTVDYRRKILLLGLANGLAFILFERFVIPHRSLDEDPVTAAPPGAILVTTHGGGPAAGDGCGTGAAAVNGENGDGDGGQDGAHLEEEDEQAGRSRLWRCLNDQPNCFLPRIGHKTPLYQKGSLAFA